MKKLILCIVLLLTVTLSGCSLLNLGDSQGEKNNSDVSTSVESERINETQNTIAAKTDSQSTLAELKVPILKSITPVDIDSFEIEWSEVDGADGQKELSQAWRKTTSNKMV